MNPLPSNSDRRRRLTIAALVLLVLGGGLWWSTRPRIDPRLVGTWTYVRTSDRQVPAQRRFDADGFSYLLRPGDEAIPFRWRVVDNEVQLRLYHGKGWRGWLKNLVEAMTEIRGVKPEVIRFTIVEVTDNSFTWQQASKTPRTLPPATYVRALAGQFISDKETR